MLLDREKVGVILSLKKRFEHNPIFAWLEDRNPSNFLTNEFIPQKGLLA